MSTARASLWSQVWRGLRSLARDDSYERYLEHLAAHHPTEPPLSPARFYVSELERRWNRDGPTRCC